MSKHNESDWEKHWQKEFFDFAPPAHAEDWQHMHQLLDTKVSARAHHLMEQDTTGSLLKTLKRPFLKLSWQKWLGIALLITAMGYWLGTTHSENVYKEINKGIISQDTFPPNYVLDRYWIYDANGNRTGEMQSDTLWRDRIIRRKGSPVLLNSGIVSDYRIDTILLINGHGILQSVRFDTISTVPGRNQSNSHNHHHSLEYNDCVEEVKVRYDTIYLLDSLGNLTTEIFSIDSTIILPGL